MRSFALVVHGVDPNFFLYRPRTPRSSWPPTVSLLQDLGFTDQCTNFPDLPCFAAKRSYEGGRLILRLRIAASTTGERQQWQACTIVSGSRRRFMRRSSSARRAGSLPSLVLIAIGRAFIGSPVAIWLI